MKNNPIIRGSADLDGQNLDKTADLPLFGRKLSDAAAVNYESIHPDDLRSLESYLAPYPKPGDESSEENNDDFEQHSKFKDTFLQIENNDNNTKINDEPALNTRSIVGADGSENIIIKISASTADKSRKIPGKANVEEILDDDVECVFVKDEFNPRNDKSREDTNRESRERRRRSSSRKRKHRSSRSSSRKRRRNSSTSHRDRIRERSRSRGKRKRSPSRSRRSRDRSSERYKRKNSNSKKKDLLEELKEDKRKSSSNQRIIKDIRKHLQKNITGEFFDYFLVQLLYNYSCLFSCLNGALFG